MDEEENEVPDPWPIVGLSGIDLYTPFDKNMTERFNLQRDPNAEEQLEFVNEVWRGENESDSLSIDVHDGHVVGVSAHGNVVIRETQMVGLTLADVIQRFGNPFLVDIDGSGLCDYHDGPRVLTFGFWDNAVTWASLNDNSFLDEDGN